MALALDPAAISSVVGADNLQPERLADLAVRNLGDGGPISPERYRGWFARLAIAGLAAGGGNSAAEFVGPGVGLRRELEWVGVKTQAPRVTPTSALLHLGMLVAGAAHCGSVDARQVTQHARQLLGATPDQPIDAGLLAAYEIALPVLRADRRRGMNDRLSRLDAAIAVMAALEDPTVRMSGGPDVVQRAAGCVVIAGGASTRLGRRRLDWLRARCPTDTSRWYASHVAVGGACFLDALPHGGTNAYDV